MKKVFSVILSVVIILSFAGCMGGRKNNPPTVQPTDATDMDEIQVMVYFPDSEVMYLIAEERTILKSDIVDMAAAVVDEILKGPEDEKLNKSIRGDVKVLSIAVDDKGLCTIDLSKEFETYNTGGSAMESMAIYSLVNSLCSLDGIDRVKIDIEGDKGAEYGGHFLMDEPFEEDTGFYGI